MLNTVASFINKKFGIDAHYFLRGCFWLSLGQSATIGFGLLSTALFAHFLTPEQYGIYKYLVSVSVILATFSLSGLGPSILQATAKKYTNFYHETLRINFLYSLLISIAALIGTAYYWFKGNETLALGCLMVAVIQPIVTTFQNSQSYLQGSQKYKESTTLHVIRMVITTVLSVGILFITKNILFLFLFYLLGLLAANLFGHNKYIEKSGIPTPPHIFSKYINYAKHSSLRNVIANVAQKADSIIIFTQLGAAELAVYSIAVVIPEQIKGSFKNLASLLLPKYVAHIDQEVLKKSILKRSIQLLLILLVITAIYIFLAPLVYGAFFPKYSEAIFLSQLLALSFPAAVAIIPGSFLQSQLSENSLYKLNLFEAASSLFLLFFLTVSFGVLGTIYAKIITRYITLTYSYILIFRAKTI